MNLNKYFDKIYVINLKKDVHKLKSFYEKIENLNIDVELFVGIDGATLDFKSCNPEDVPNKVSFLENKYARGCLLSHLDIVKQALTKNYKRILIFEDDVLFAKDFCSLVKRLEKIQEWKLLYLGGSQYNWFETEYSENFYKARRTCGTFAYAIDQSVYNDMLHMHEENDCLTIDGILREIQSNYRNDCYVFYPNICIADVSQSNIRSPRNQEEHSKKMKWDLIEYENNIKFKSQFKDLVEFYKTNDIDEEFDECTYEKFSHTDWENTPKLSGFLEPECTNNGITYEQRAYYHWYIYRKDLEVVPITHRSKISRRLVKNNKLAVITSFFNPSNYSKTKINYSNFSTDICNSEDLFPVELSFDNNFFITNKNCIRVNAEDKNILWQKEALLNIALEQLPKEYTDVAWVDCDVIFQNKDWTDKVFEKLRSYKIVQMFNTVRFNEKEQMVSCIKSYCDPNIAHMGAFGYAWAGRREVLDEIKFLDNQILGSADMVMGYSFLNRDIPSFRKDSYRDNNYTQQWIDKCKKVICGSVHYADNTIQHLYHGSKSNRKYKDRYKINVNDSDLLKDSNGIWRINNEKTTNEIVKYFNNRKEDD